MWREERASGVAGKTASLVVTKGGRGEKKSYSSSSSSAPDYVRCVSLFELADDLDVEHEISSIDVFHHVVQAILQGANTRRCCSQTLRSKNQFVIIIITIMMIISLFYK